MSTTLLCLNGAESLGSSLARLRVPANVEAWAGIRGHDDPLASTAYGSRWPYAGFLSLEIDAAGDQVAALTAELLQELDPVVDRARSCLVLGTTYRIIDGRSDVALVYLIHRVASATVEQYQDHWLNRHGPLARELVPTRGYEQTHADHRATVELATSLGLSDEGFDGIATCFFDTRDDFADMLAARESSLDMNAIYEDELRFLDHSRSLGAMMRRISMGSVRA